MIQLPRPWASTTQEHEKWYSCKKCGAFDIKVDIPFTSGSVEPQEGEVLTGATSGETATVVSVSLSSGSWAGGDAAGWVLCSAPSTWDFDTGHWGTEDEDINGSTGGNNILTVNGYGHIKKYGRLYRKGEIIESEWGNLCTAHYEARTRFKDLDAVELDDTEGDRLDG